VVTTTKDIRGADVYSTCDVCGRTLLRGEKAEVYLNGRDRRSVCELCKDRAIHEGWIREGTMPPPDDAENGSERRRSLLGRFRSRREPAGDELERRVSAEPEPRRGPPAREERRREPRGERAREVRSAPGREPRHVHAVPTSVEHTIASGIEAFNASEHPRTVAGVARSLGPPTVSVAPAGGHPGLVSVVVSWELCWYRYDVDLAEERPTVRVAGQGYELTELSPQELRPNAVADEYGVLALR
jgi:hypothetical protein